MSPLTKSEADLWSAKLDVIERNVGQLRGRIRNHKRGLQTELEESIIELNAIRAGLVRNNAANVALGAVAMRLRGLLDKVDEL